MEHYPFPTYEIRADSEVVGKKVSSFPLLLLARDYETQGGPTVTYEASASNDCVDGVSYFHLGLPAKGYESHVSLNIRRACWW